MTNSKHMTTIFKLKQLVNQHGGEELFLETNKLLLQDLIDAFFADDERTKRNLKRAVDDGVTAQLLILKNKDYATREAQVKQIKHNFIEINGLDEKFGNEIIDALVETICPKSTISSIQPPPSKITNFTDKFGIEMIAVEGGTFWMGAQKTDPNAPNYDTDAYDGESPVHKVTLSDYYIGKYPVTQAQWKAVMGSNPSNFKGDNLPVEEVSWDDVQEFIRKLNAQTGKSYRLPTEAEWEFAARGGNSSRGYKYSGSNTAGSVAWNIDNRGEKTHPVGTKQANELGIYDMSGNVWEWCSDWYGSYSSGSQTNPKGANSDSDRVHRGGCRGNSAWCVRVSRRGSSNPDDRGNYLGFRLALSSN
jgi:formylglycine-generating enzyme required for sulfatase activity